MAIEEKDELAELLAEYFADEKAEREADEAGYRLFMEAPENPEYEVKPDCPSTDRIRAVWLEQATWNRDEKQHIDSCQHCRVFIPYFQTRLNDCDALLSLA